MSGSFEVISGDRGISPSLPRIEPSNLGRVGNLGVLINLAAITKIFSKLPLKRKGNYGKL